jgi:hypothetical protein
MIPWAPSTIKPLILIGIVTILVVSGCVQDQAFEVPSQLCKSEIFGNTSFEDVKNLYEGEVVEIVQDWILEGHVISSDREGNFFNTLHFQDRSSNANNGFQIDIDLRDSYLLYEVGDKIYIQLKGLYLGESKGILKLGSAYTAFGNKILGRLPYHAVSRHLVKGCEQGSIVPRLTNIGSLDSLLVNTLIKLDNVEVVDEELGLPFAVAEETTKRKIIDCEGDELVLLNSGYSDFQPELLPMGNGTITGVYYQENNESQIIIREVSDIDFNQERCEEIITEFTSEEVLISEIADPDNNNGARFVELYFSGKDTISLNGWSLRRYTNQNNTVGSTIDLSSFSLRAAQTLVIAANSEVFQQVYGFPPDLEAGTNSPADSNGDDNLELVDPFGKVIDIFGIVGEDGSGTNHEFEDGRAQRKSEIRLGNPIYSFSEWIIYNDTGASGTTNQPQNAPQDFSPGARD